MNEKKRCGIKARLSIATGIVSIVLATGIIAGCTQDVSPDEPEQRNPVIITWNGQMDVTAGGKSLSSGQQVLEGTTITITPSQEGDPVALLLAALGQDTPPPHPLSYTGTQASYVIPRGSGTISFSLERQALGAAPAENQARVIFVGNTSLPAGSSYSYTNQIKTYWETGSSTRKTNFDIQWPTVDSPATPLALEDYVTNTYKADFAKNPHGAVCLFGEAELTAAAFDASLFTAQYAAVLSGFMRARAGATAVAVSLLPQDCYPDDVAAKRWQEVDKAIRAAAKTAGATLVDLKALYAKETELAGNQTRAQRRIAEEIFLGWYPTVEPYSVIPSDKDIPITPQQKWTNGTMQVIDGEKVWTANGNGNQDFTKYNLIKTIAEKAPSQWPQVIFTGDSITDIFDGSFDGNQPALKMSSPWSTYIGYKDDGTIGSGTATTYRALNLGNSGDFTQSLLFRWQNLPDNQYSGAYTGAFAFKDTVKAIVLNIGTNNIGPSSPTINKGEAYNQERPISSVDTVRGIQKVLELMKKEFPKAKIILMGLFPRGEFTTSAKRTTTDFLRLQVLSVDRQLANLYGNGQDSRVTYLYLYESFVDDAGNEKTGTFDGFEGTYTNLFYDTLHPNNAGYKIWWDGIEPKIKSALGL